MTNLTAAAKLQWQTQGPAPQNMLSPLDAKLSLDEATETMVIPEMVIVTQQDLSRVLFKPGVQEVPAHLADHWYLKAAGAQRYAKSQTPTLENVAILETPQPEVEAKPKSTKFLVKA
jgi:hypothetical protein